MSYNGYMPVDHTHEKLLLLKTLITSLMDSEYMVESEARNRAAQYIGRTKRSVDRYLSKERPIPQFVASKIEALLSQKKSSKFTDGV